MSITTCDEIAIISSLESTFDAAIAPESVSLPNNIEKSVRSFSKKIGRATSAFTNIVTCLAVKGFVQLNLAGKPGLLRDHNLMILIIEKI